MPRLEALFRRLEVWDEVSDAEKAALEATVDGAPFIIPAGTDLVREGDRPDRSIMLLSGFATRYRVTAEGKRQITAINLTGDFVDLPSMILKTMDHSVGALSDLNVVSVPHGSLRSVIEAFPHLGRLLWLSTLLDTAITREWVVGMGRLSSAQHLAHLICELYVRLRIIGHADRSFALPLTQSDLGDALGLSVVHVNRTLQELRGESLFTWEGGVVTIIDWARLQERAEFDPQYLHLQREPR